MKTRKITLLCLGLWAGVVVQTRANIQWAGVNLSGAEFGQTSLPPLGTYGSTYSYPTTAEVDYYKSKGMNFIRLPFRWERWQHTNNAALDATELSHANPFIAYATSKGMYVDLDPHNFQRYFPYPRTNYQASTIGLVGSASTPDSVFTNFWSQVAAIYRTNPLVIFGLNNEPANMSTAQLVTAENAAIAAIRDTGATNTIFVPGNGYSGAWTWDETFYGTANAVAMTGIVDPGHNFAFEAHQYFDSDGSGTTTNIGSATTGSSRLVVFTQWLRANHYKGFLGEFAVANSTIGGAGLGGPALTNMLGYVEANSDVWTGWAWWGGGPLWGNYMFTIEPSNLGKSTQKDRAVMGVVKHFLPLPVPALQIVNQSHFQSFAPQGFTYQLQSTTDLSSGQWAPDGAPFAGTGLATNFPLMMDGKSSGFYRLSVGHAP